MKIVKIALLLLVVAFSSCASTYTSINPNSLNYVSKSTDKGVALEYKYELLSKKYNKKEVAKGIRLVAVKLTNNSTKDLVFGKDLKLTYDNDNVLYVMENEKVFSSLKQNIATYLFYLLLTPLQFIKTEGNGFQQKTSTTPIGLVIGPGLTAGNMITASSANKKFKKNLLEYNLNGKTIKRGATVSGLIGIRSDDYNAIKVKVD